LDLSSSLYHYGARYYDAGLGRFVQPDTVVPEPGNPQALNRYSYGYNNAARYSNPTGHFIPRAIAAVFSGNVLWPAIAAGLAALAVSLVRFQRTLSEIDIQDMPLPSAVEGIRQFAKAAQPKARWVDGPPPDVVKRMRDLGLHTGASPGQAPGGGGDLDPNTRALLRILLGIVLAAEAIVLGKGTTPEDLLYGQLTRHNAMRFPVIRKRKWPEWLQSQVIRWENQFYCVHGRMPGYQDYLDRIWSLEFLAQHGRPPTEEEWEEHYYQRGGQ
jgi:RHS repeat-associated protein